MDPTPRDRYLPLAALPKKQGSTFKENMFEITGIDKMTLRRVRVAIADCIVELRMILRQERKNYYDMAVMRVA